jgi:hypothetical protein
MTLKERLPPVLATENVRVNENHTLRVSGNGKVREYTLDKAPIQKIEEVNGELNGRDHTFVKNSDYELANGKTIIRWIGDTPDSGTVFTVTYVSDSVMSRYLEAHQEQFDSVEDAITAAVDAKFISTASGDELDELGELFDEIGSRNGRSDADYKRFLRTIVNSFISRGTKSGIKLAVSSVTGVDIEEIGINEDFSDNSYTVSIGVEETFNSNDVAQAAELADPSGINFDGTTISVSGASLGVGVSDSQVVSSTSQLGSDGYTLGSFDIGE